MHRSTMGTLLGTLLGVSSSGIVAGSPVANLQSMCMSGGAIGAVMGKVLGVSASGIVAAGPISVLQSAIMTRDSVPTTRRPTSTRLSLVRILPVFALLISLGVWTVATRYDEKKLDRVLTMMHLF